MSDTMTTQEVFDTVYKHLMTQKAQSLDFEELNCKYRGEDGMKCAIGCLIKDEEYRPEMEEKTVLKMLAYARTVGIKTLADRLEPHAILLERLQTIHDRRDEEEWRESLAVVAQEYELTIPEMS